MRRRTRGRKREVGRVSSEWETKRKVARGRHRRGEQKREIERGKYVEENKERKVQKNR